VAVELPLANNDDLALVRRGLLPPDQVRRARIPAVVDTGALHLVLPEGVISQLGLPAAGQMTVRYADNRFATLNLVNQVEVELLGRHGTFRAVVQPSRTDALIGAIVLEDLDLLVDCASQTLQPRDPKGPVTEIE
jgi:clan AA aspartic protease